MPENNIMTIHVGPTGRKVFTDNLEMNQNSSNNVLELFCEGKYEFVQVFYTFPDGKTTYKHHMIPDGFIKDKAAYKFHDNIDKAVTSFVIPNVTAHLKVSFIGYYKNNLNQYTPVGINDFLITVIRVNNNEVYDQTYNGSDVVNIWKNINNLNAILGDLDPNYTSTTLEELKAKVDANYNELKTRLDSVPDVEDFYTKEEIHQMFGTVYKYAGSVDNVSDLPTNLTNEQTGVVINVRYPNGMNYAWTGSAWDALGGFDESNYYNKDYIDTTIRATQLKAKDDTAAVDNKVNNLATTHSSDILMLRNDITQINAQFADYYNKSEVNSKVSGVFKFMGSKATLGDLPKTGNRDGDVWNVVADNNNNYVWTAAHGWESLGPIVNLSNFYTKEVIDQKLSGLLTADNVYTKAQTYNRTEIDDKIKVATDASSLNQTALSNLANRVDTHTADFTDFKTNTNTALERIEREYKAADETLNTAIASEATLRSQADETINARINEVEGNINTKINEVKGNLNSRIDEVEGSISTAQSAAEAYADRKVGEVATSVSELSIRVDGIETSANDYTDQQVGALTQTFNNYTSTTNNRITQLETKVTSVYTLKGSCTYEELTAKTENSVGDVWNVTDKDSQNYVWTGSEWDTLGSIADFSEYAKTSEVNAQIEAAEGRLNTKIENTENRLNNKIVDVEGRLNGSIETTFNDLNTELQSLTATVSTNKTSTETAISNLSNDTVHLNTFNSFKTSNTAAINAVDTRVTNLTSSVNTALTKKANASEVYTKNESDSKFLTFNDKISKAVALVDANNEARTIKLSTTSTASVNTYTIERAPSIVDGFEDNIYA